MFERFRNSVTFFVLEKFDVGELGFEINPSDEVSEAANGCLEKAT